MSEYRDKVVVTATMIALAVGTAIITLQPQPKVQYSEPLPIVTAWKYMDSLMNPHPYPLASQSGVATGSLLREDMKL